MEKVVFTPNMPVQVALKYPEGKPVDGRFGDQMMYTLLDGRVMYLDMDVATKINLLGPRRGETFWIAKRWTGKKSDSPQWDVWGVEAGEVIPANLARLAEAGVSAPAPAKAATTAAYGNGHSNNGNGSSTNGNGSNGRPYNAAGIPTPPTKVPIAVAVSDAVAMMQNALKANNEQWADGARQDLVSTILITYQREGWLCLGGVTPNA
jgi:hypothetical protein